MTTAPVRQGTTHVLGICESVSPDYFEITEDGDVALLREDVPADRVDELEEAVQGCPTEALRLQT